MSEKREFQADYHVRYPTELNNRLKILAAMAGMSVTKYIEYQTELWIASRYLEYTLAEERVAAQRANMGFIGDGWEHPKQI